MLKNSIDKLNQQIDMLQNKKFIEKTQIKKVKPIVKNRKEILEEDTIVNDDMFSDLMGSNEKTKVFAANEFNTDKSKFIDSSITIDNIEVKTNGFIKIFLIIFVVFLIILLLLFIFI